MTNTYDYIITGGGAAGRSFICQLLRSPLRDKRVLLIDREPKLVNDRTWCFWEKGPGFFEDIVFHSWDNLWVHTDEFSRSLSIAPYAYKLIRGIDFYEYTDQLINKYPNVERLYGEVEALTSTEKGAEVVVDGNTYRAEWCFNSIFFGKIDKQKVNYLDQHFRGWFLRSDTAIFDPGQATLMDFRTPQQEEIRFLYLLPHNAREALVEIAIFSNRHQTAEGYDQILKTYLKKYLPELTGFEITQTEMGNIPMTDYPFQKSHNNIIHLGMAGGDTRASSGYTFYNVQNRVASIIRQLIRKGNPLVKEAWPIRRARFYDKLMLRVLEKGYYPGDRLFQKLFTNNKPSTVLAFLNAETNVQQEVRLAASLPHLPFWKAVIEEFTQMKAISVKPNLPQGNGDRKTSRNSV